MGYEFQCTESRFLKMYNLLGADDAAISLGEALLSIHTNLSLKYTETIIKFLNFFSML